MNSLDPTPTLAESSPDCRIHALTGAATGNMTAHLGSPRTVTAPALIQLRASRREQ